MSRPTDNLALAKAWFVAGRIADFKCERCKATGGDIAEKCNAPLDAPCPGFKAMDKASGEFTAEWRKSQRR